MPPAAQTFLPSLGDVITAPVTQVTVSAEGIVGPVDQSQWHSLHTKKPAAQLQSKKKGQSPISLLSARNVNDSLCFDIEYLVYSSSTQVENLDTGGQSLPHQTLQ